MDPSINPMSLELSGVVSSTIRTVSAGFRFFPNFPFLEDSSHRFQKRLETPDFSPDPSWVVLLLKRSGWQNAFELYWMIWHKGRPIISSNTMVIAQSLASTWQSAVCSPSSSRTCLTMVYIVYESLPYTVLNVCHFQTFSDPSQKHASVRSKVTIFQVAELDLGNIWFSPLTCERGSEVVWIDCCLLAEWPDA